MNKEKYYNKYKSKIKGFIAQGSEFGFGKMYALGINDEVITKKDQFIHVVSCNTHNMAVLIHTLAIEKKKSHQLTVFSFGAGNRNGHVRTNNAIRLSTPWCWGAHRRGARQCV